MATREEIIAIPVPEKSKGARGYTPIENKRIIETIYEEFDKEGLVIHSDTYKIAKKNNQFIGEFRVSNSGDPDISMALVFQNSYDKSLSFKLASGGWTFACFNGMVTGEKGTFKRRHNGDADVISIEEVKKQIGIMQDEFKRNIEFKNRLKEIEITKQTIAELTGRLFLEENLIQSNQLSIIKQEFDSPQFDYGCEDKVWNFYSNITHAYKNLHPMLYIQKQKDLAKFFENEYHLC